MIVYDPAVELAHPPEDDRAWQESIVALWLDPSAGVGGYLRIGQHPVDGVAGTVVGIVTDEGLRFRRHTRDIRLQPADRSPSRFGAGAFSYELAGTHGHFEVDDPDCEVVVDFHDFYPPTDWDPSRELTDIAAGHHEASGRVTGTVRVGERVFEIDGLGHRDHSWGVRHWDLVVCHRWCGGTCGPELSWSAVIVVLPDGSLMKNGFVVRHGEVTVVEDVDILTCIEPDGWSVRSGHCRMTLPDGEVLHVECEPVDGIVLGHGSYLGTEAMSRVRCGELEGIADLNMSNNPRRGTAEPASAIAAVASEGISQRDR